MPCGWKGNHRSGVALATRQTFVVLHLRAQGLEDALCSYALLWSMVDFTFTFNSFSALTLLLGQQEGHPTCKKLGVGLLLVMIWLELCTTYSSSCHHLLCFLCFNKHRLTQVHLENGRKNRERLSSIGLNELSPNSYLIVFDTTGILQPSTEVEAQCISQY